MHNRCLISGSHYLLSRVIRQGGSLQTAMLEFLVLHMNIKKLERLSDLPKVTQLGRERADIWVRTPNSGQGPHLPHHCSEPRKYLAMGGDNVLEGGRRCRAWHPPKPVWLPSRPSYER